jgi:GTPase
VPGFVDEAQVHVRAGDGGAGAVSFRREAHVARGGPDGGDGGLGGSVWLVAGTNQSSLLAFRDHPHRRAGDGRHGQGKKRHGASGADLEVPVPLGTTVRHGGVVVADLAGPGDRWLAGRGGSGGRGNARFLSNRRRAPAFAEQGERGEESWLDLELKLLADVALVGFPNAGKSTLISAVSAARPKVAAYPFTTLVPHLGVVRVGAVGEDGDFVVADVPGLVEGAAQGRGLGHRFLRHVERARVLVLLLDLHAADGRSPAAQAEVLLDELGRYQAELLDRPRLLVGSKLDLGPAPAAEDGPELSISAVTGEGVDALVHRLAGLVAQAREGERRTGGGVVVHRPLPEGVEVRRGDNGEFVVSGRAALRAVALSDLTVDDAVDYVQERLRRLGVERALARAGARDGDTVQLGPLTFTYRRDDLESATPAVGRAGVPSTRRTRSGRRR